MGHKSFSLLAVTIVVLLVGAAGVYAYDSSRKDIVSEGVTVGGVDIGGLDAQQAREKVRREVAEPLRRPVVVRHGGKRFTLSARESRARPDVDGMVEAALKRGRDGNLISRTFRGLAGGEVDEDIKVDVTYSRPAVSRLVKRVRAGVERPAKDASVSFDGGAIQRVPGETGRRLKAGKLEGQVERALLRPGAGVITARTKATRPKVTTDRLEEKYPTFLRVDRTNFKLVLYKRLKVKKTYTIAIGAVGFDTPAGVYNIQNKGENVPWNVPKKPWAGKLAGTIVPGGAPNNPLKARWLGIFDGAGIHGTDQTGSLGTRASHGCVRMAIPDVIELYPQVDVGAPVYIG